MIKDVLIDNSQDWRQKHLDYFQTNYSKKYKEISFLKELYNRDWEKIVDFNIEFITQCCQYLEITTKLVRASELEVEGKKSHLVLDICKKLKATEILPNEGSKIYLEKDKEIFEKENIKIAYHKYKHPKYNQKGDKFLKNLAILDLLFSEYENSKKFV